MAITAVPVGDSYVAPTGGVISGGRYRWPAWRRAMVKGQCAQIPTSLLSAIDPSNDPTLNPNYPSRAPWALTESGNANFTSLDGVMIPWCGGAWDEDKSEFRLDIGGGHGDSGNNGAWAIGLNSDAPQWFMRRAPSGSLPLIAGGLPAGSTPQGNSFLLDDHQEASGIFADGRMRPIHSYRKYVFVPGLGTVMPVQGGPFANVQTSVKTTWLMELDSNEWVHKSSNAALATSYNDDDSACYDDLRGCVYRKGAGASQIKRLDLDTWALSNLTAVMNISGGSATIYVKEYDIIIEVADYYTEKFRVVDVATATVYNPGVTGTVKSLWSSIALAWVPGLGLVCHSGVDVWVMTPTGNPKTAPWEWTQLAITGGWPSASGFNVYTKFGYSKKLGGCYRFLNSTTKPWFFATE